MDQVTSVEDHGVFLTEENKKPFRISHGFAHSFSILSNIAEIYYKSEDFYYLNDVGDMARNDPELGVEWPKLVGTYNCTASTEIYFVNGVGLLFSI